MHEASRSQVPQSTAPEKAGSLVRTLTPQYGRNRWQQYFEIFSERLIADVFEIQLDPLAVLHHLAAAADLPMARHPRLRRHEQHGSVSVLRRFVRHYRRLPRQG